MLSACFSWCPNYDHRFWFDMKSVGEFKDSPHTGLRYMLCASRFCFCEKWNLSGLNWWLLSPTMSANAPAECAGSGSGSPLISLSLRGRWVCVTTCPVKWHAEAPAKGTDAPEELITRVLLIKRSVKQSSLFFLELKLQLNVKDPLTGI